MKRKKIHRNTINWDKVFFPGWIKFAMEFINNSMPRESVYRALKKVVQVDRLGQIKFIHRDTRSEFDIHSLIDYLLEEKTQYLLKNGAKVKIANFKLQQAQEIEML